MAIKFVKTKRHILFGNNPGEKYVARLHRSSDVSMDQLCDEISHSTTVSYPDVLAVLKAMEIHVSAHVLRGSAVKFGMLGAFIPSIRATAMESAEDANADSIRRLSCRFYPSVHFKYNLSKAKFEEANLNIKGLVQ